MPLKYFCAKCDKRFIDWGAEKLGFKCPNCSGAPLYRVGSQLDGESGAPSLSKSAAKRKVKPKVKVTPDVVGEFDEVEIDPLIGAADDDVVDDDVVLDDDEGEIIGDSLALDED